ncbi:DNA processing protein DprA [Cellulomonas chitinilytica]|uniref:DNA processing protein DprA n=1 Tax=Cellulomonas chitinilytica TaxID=398759 RepID=A0A919P349_9CELL|nr:DNA-processing protein DprA [Cellulomonas chitinilytica]GIG21835.1 DNA processing protein DprA [Cellulomonas chitinilytica]
MAGPPVAAPAVAEPRIGPLPDVADRELKARVAWSGLAEPGDRIAGALVRALGPADALEWLSLSGDDRPVPWGPLEERVGPLPTAQRGRLERSVRRWATRLPTVEPERDLEVLTRMGGSVLVPDDARWPVGLDDLGDERPFCLWVRGVPDLARAWRRGVALVGSRAATTYGERVAFDLAESLGARGVTVVSGGAYGVDAASHRGALSAGGATSVVLAGGVDRAYPLGNARLFEAVVGAGGSVVAELGPGRVPTKSRFLQRNRLIAAGSRATVVVEAAWRSGAMSSAHHAARLLRPVGAVPGPVTSAASAGCHRLLRDGIAVCVTDADEVAELAGSAGCDLVDERVEAPRPGDGLDPVTRRVLEALPRRVPTDLATVASSAGVTTAEARAALGLLELDGSAVRSSAGWRMGTRG